MAALTMTDRKYGQEAPYITVRGDLAAVADGDTLVPPGLGRVEECEVHAVGADVTQSGVTPFAADQVNVASIVGRTVTFQVGGTARAARVICKGYR